MLSHYQISLWSDYCFVFLLIKLKNCVSTIVLYILSFWFVMEIQTWFTIDTKSNNSPCMFSRKCYVFPLRLWKRKSDISFSFFFLFFPSRDKCGQISPPFLTQKAIPKRFSNTNKRHASVSCRFGQVWTSLDRIQHV